MTTSSEGGVDDDASGAQDRREKLGHSICEDRLVASCRLSLSSPLHCMPPLIAQRPKTRLASPTAATKPPREEPPRPSRIKARPSSRARLLVTR